MENALNNLIKELKEPLAKKPSKLIIPMHESLELSSSNFHDISDVSSNKKIAFVDGGNNEILKTPSMSLQFVRVYYNVFECNKKISSDKCEFFILVDSYVEEDKQKYKAKMFAVKGELLVKEEDLSFDAHDFTIKQGVFKAPASKIAEIARKFAEWTICLKIMNSLDKGDVIIKDGTLDANITGEDRYKKAVADIAAQKGVLLAGVAKTNSIIADNGEAASKVLDEMASLRLWKYYPAVKDGRIYFVKLNANSKYVFRLDVLDKEVEEMLSLLVENSKDPVFLGYPYGLIDADKIARVSNSERDYIKMKVEMKLGKGFKELEMAINSVNAHSVLDSA